MCFSCEFVTYEETMVREMVQNATDAVLTDKEHQVSSRRSKNLQQLGKTILERVTSLI